MDLKEISNHLKIKEGHEKELVLILNQRKLDLETEMKNFGPSIFIFTQKYNDFYNKTLQIRKDIEFLDEIIKKNKKHKDVKYQTDWQKISKIIFS